MLHRDLYRRSTEGPPTAEPFVDHNTQCILIAGWAGLALNLLRGHVGNGSPGLFGVKRACTMHYGSDAKVTEPHHVVGTQQNILRLNIAMDQTFVVGILQGGSNRFDIS